MKILKINYNKFITKNSKFFVNFSYLFIFLTLLIYLAPYILLGSKNYFFITDNLDSIYVELKILLDSGKLFSSNHSIIEQPLGGLPRSSFGSQFNIFFLLINFFGLEKAYILTRIVITLVAFFGMSLLLKKHILTKSDDKLIILFISLCFSISSFPVLSLLSLAGIPLVLFAFLEIRKKNYNIKNWIIIILFPFFSNFVVYGFFFLFIPLAIILKDIFNRKVNTYFIFSFILISLLYLFVEYRLLDQFILSKDFISHRTEKFKPIEVDLYKSIKMFAKFFFNNTSKDYHGIHALLIAPFITIASLFIFFLPNSKFFFKKNIFKYVLISIIIATLIASDFPPFLFITNFLNEFIPFNFKRFILLYPFFWMIALALVMSCLQNLHSHMKILTISFMIFQTLNSFKNHEIIISHNFFGAPSVRSFFAVEQFSKIDEYIGKPHHQYRVASIGLHPSISLYNGFYTADGYFVNYPLLYKQKFRNVIEKELSKDNNLKSYYDNWGSRVYLFSSEIGRNFNFRAGNKVILKNLEYDWKLLYQLGVRYIFSSVQINNQKIPELFFEKVFIDKNSAWDIYLYKLETF